MSEELKSCPICEEEAEVSIYGRENTTKAGFYVECVSCSASGPPFDIEGEAPEQKAAMRDAQRASWARAFCEHGDFDFETCPHCLQDFADRRQS